MLEWIKDLFKPNIVIERPCQACQARQQHIDSLYEEVSYWKTEYKECRDKLFALAHIQFVPAGAARQEPGEKKDFVKHINPRSWNQVKSKLESEHRNRPMTPESAATDEYWRNKNAKAQAEIPELKQALSEQTLSEHDQDMRDLSAS